MSHIRTTGLEFVEFSCRTHGNIEPVLERLGFAHVATHKHKDVLLYRQNQINFVLNHEPDSLAATYAAEHGPSSNALCFRVENVEYALESAARLNAEVISEPVGPLELNIPAIRGVGGALIYLVEEMDHPTIYDIDFDIHVDSLSSNPGSLEAIDHITQNVPQGELDRYVDFYKRVFGFGELQHFNIHGRHSGLRSTALTSPCGRIKIPLNEPTDDKSQIAEYLVDHHGAGVQHIALATTDIYDAVDASKQRGIAFQRTPGAYYDDVARRVGPHAEDLDDLRRLGILIDGNASHGFLLQIFTENVFGSFFFELIQRKGNRGFGEGNFQALFESIEREQVERGVFS